MSGPVIGFRTRKDAQRNFFDRAAVISALDRTTATVFARFGAFVRQRAKTSIRKRKKASPPGSPPSSHLGLLRDNIFFSFDQDSRSLVVGPVLLNGRAHRDAPRALEYGGAFTRRNKRGSYQATYKARPFMTPAFDAELPGLPRMWANALSR
ncbi:MAG TPA: hypothetical protein DCS97_07035 [Planctomycetes bacterium]|nr:hypothetical protein [Planctomycetota bacterium]